MKKHKVWFLKIGNSRVIGWDGHQDLINLPTHGNQISTLRSKLKNADEVWVCSVVPKFNSVLKRSFTKKKLIFVSPKMIPIRPAYVQGIGIDRLMNLYAGFRMAKQSFVVIDLGTAMTVDFLKSTKGKEARHLGGWILAGPDILSKALHQNTALLPLVDLRRENFALRMGNSTQTSISSGLAFYLRGIFSEAGKMGERLFGKNSHFPIFVTGGRMDSIPNISEQRMRKIPNLGLRGLILLRNELAKEK